MDKPRHIFRRTTKSNFVSISRSSLQASDLSWEATGLLSYLLSLPDTWELNLCDLVGRKTNGRDSTRSAIKELLDAGHLTKMCVKEKGIIREWSYDIHEERVSQASRDTVYVEYQTTTSASNHTPENQNTVFQLEVKPRTGNQPQDIRQGSDHDHDHDHEDKRHKSALVFKTNPDPKKLHQRPSVAYMGYQETLAKRKLNELKQQALATNGEERHKYVTEHNELFEKVYEFVKM